MDPDPDSNPDPQHCLTHPTEVEGCLVVDSLGGGAEAEESNQAGGAHKAAVVGPFAVVVVQAVRAHVHNNLKQELFRLKLNPLLLLLCRPSAHTFTTI